MPKSVAPTTETSAARVGAGPHAGGIGGGNTISHVNLIANANAQAKAACRRRRRTWDHLSMGNRADTRHSNGVAAAQSHAYVNSPARILSDSTRRPANDWVTMYRKAISTP